MAAEVANAAPWATVALAIIAAIPTILIATARAIRIIKKELKEGVAAAAHEVKQEVQNAATGTNIKLDNAESQRQQVHQEVTQKLDDTKNATERFIEINDRITRHNERNREHIELLQAELTTLHQEVRRMQQGNPMPPTERKL